MLKPISSPFYTMKNRSARIRPKEAGLANNTPEIQSKGSGVIQCIKIHLYYRGKRRKNQPIENIVRGVKSGVVFQS